MGKANYSWLGAIVFFVVFFVLHSGIWTLGKGTQVVGKAMGTW